MGEFIAVYVFFAPRINVVARHVVFCGAKIAPNSERYHEANIGENRQLPALLAAAPGHVIGHLKILLFVCKRKS